MNDKDDKYDQIAACVLILGALAAWGFYGYQKAKKELANKSVNTPPTTLPPFMGYPPRPPSAGNPYMNTNPYLPPAEEGGFMQQDQFMARILAPNGRVLDIVFSREEWEMMKSLSEMSGDAFEDVIIDIVSERSKNGLL